MTATTYGRPGRGFGGGYLDDGLSTATPSALLVMLYDRLVLDLERGEMALTRGDRATAHEQLIHAQAIVNELLHSLNVDVWDGATALASLYRWTLAELALANVRGEAAKVLAVRTVVAEPLADAWRQAAAMSQATGSVTGAGGVG